MSVSKSHELVASEQELLEVVNRELAGAGPGGDLVIMGGHFMLFENEEGRLVSGIIEEQDSEVMRRRIAGRVGIFPLYTWRMSVDLLREHPEARLLLLVNDWQYVPQNGRPAGELRAEYYDGFTQLPSSYEKELRSAGLSPDSMLASRKHPLAFPETWLKYRFQKTAAKLVKQGRLEKRYLESSESKPEVSFLDENGNYRTLMSCGITGCAGEMTEMVAEVYNAGYRRLLVFAPGECLNPVETGVDIALSLYGLPGMTVIITDPGGSGEMSAEEIFGGLVTVCTIRS
ncbi:LPD16 domain-containing protein [Nonomuraea typhae]|uniref:LPD16 domain-containing protein n=1 Tax=Nonomuraea typhae TaxID=2603600 RepID=UPI0012F96CD3|nr:LPD16 domain-containing protein [Nonomuraea typhae]